MNNKQTDVLYMAIVFAVLLGVLVFLVACARVQYSCDASCEDCTGLDVSCRASKIEVEGI
jgi:hypothetical protein